MVSPAQGLLMMQGGTDRTGLASLLDSVGTPGADIIAQRRADAAEQEAMDEYERREAERLAELQALIGGEEGGGEEDSGFSFGSIFRDPYTTVDEATGEITDQSKGEAYLSRGTTAAALTPALRRIVMGGKGNPYVTAGLIIPEIAYALGDYFAPETTTKIEEAVGAGYDKYVDPFVSPVTGAISDKIGEIEAGQDIQEGIFRDDLIAQGADPNSQYFDEAVRGGSMSADELAAYEEMIKNPLPDFGMADGGRVGAFSGGIMNNLLGSPQVQSMIQQYRQPTMDFSQVSSPSIPQPAVAPATPPQAYTPFATGLQQQERDRQLRAAQTLSPLQEQMDLRQTSGIASLGGVGAAYENLAQRQLQDQIARFQFGQQAPMQQLQQYAGLISPIASGFPTGINTGPGTQSGGLGGAFGGADQSRSDAGCRWVSPPRGTLIPLGQRRDAECLRHRRCRAASPMVHSRADHGACRLVRGGQNHVAKRADRDRAIDPEHS